MIHKLYIKIYIQVLAFDCYNCPAVTKYNQDQSILMIQDRKYSTFDIGSHYVGSNVEKIIWIAFYKNDDNEACLLAKLPKDLIILILKLLGKRSIVSQCITINV